MGFLAVLKRHWRLLLLILTPLLLSPLAHGTEQARCAFLLILMACYWVLEILPISLTAVLPFLLGPLLRIGTSEELAKAYFTDIQFMMVGGGVFSVAMEDSRLSRRFALRVVSLLGTQMRWLLLGFMLPSWMLSMWMSNSGTTILMFPFVTAAVAEAEKAVERLNVDEEPKALDALDPAGIKNSNCNVADPEGKKCSNEFQSHAVCYFLCVAYASSIGGIVTLIGSGTNLILIGQLQQIYQVSHVVTFSNWMAFNLPLSVISLILVWLILQVVFIGPRETFNWRPRTAEHRQREVRVRRYFVGQLGDLGPVSFAEWVTMAAFPLVLLLLLTGKLTADFGWHYLFGKINGRLIVSDATGMTVVAVLLLLVPNPSADPASLPNNLGYRPIVRWDRALTKMPLEILLVIGGGLAVAKLTKDTKLSEVIGAALTPVVRTLPMELTLLLLCFCVIWLTEVASNMAIASVLLPIVAQLAACLELNPLLFMIILTVTCSYAFCLPTATPPNAIIYASGRISIPQMARAGVVLNLTFAILLPFYALLVGRLVYGVHTVPEWALVKPCSNNASYLNGATIQVSNNTLLLN